MKKEYIEPEMQVHEIKAHSCWQGQKLLVSIKDKVQKMEMKICGKVLS
mgnify:CR=1 FL=1